RRYVLAVGAASLGAVIGAASRLYAVWLGPGHADAALVLRGLAIAVGITLSTSVGAIVSRGIGRTDLDAWFNAVMFFVHLGLSLILLPIYGLVGTLVAMLIANIVGAAFFLGLLARTLGWPRASILLE